MKHSVRFLSILGIVILLAASLAACGSQENANTSEAQTSSVSDMEGTISISGAFALYPMMQRWAEEFTKLHPKVMFDVQAGGAGKGMSDTLANLVDIGMVSRDIAPEEEAKGAYGVAVTKDAVFPTVSDQNPVLQDLLAQGLTKEQFEKLFITGEIKTWGELVGKPEISDEVHVYTRADSCGAAEVWAKYLGGKKQEDLLGIGVSGDPGLLDAVIKDPLGIGYNNLNYAYDAGGKPVAGAAVLPIDANGDGKADEQELLETKDEAQNSVATGLYPSPPARALNLVTLNKPSGIVQEFIRWILTDGQQYVGEAGYVSLTPEQIQESLDKVK
jgi:phosphate transport system substrate-binding protein